MPLRKFHDVEEMKRGRARVPGDPSLYRAMRLVLEIGRRVHPRRFPAGVHKHASIDALQAQAERWNRDHALADAPDRSHSASAYGP